jgi:hypothetical protein
MPKKGFSAEHRWRKEYGGLEIDQARRMKNLERENVPLKRLVADLSRNRYSRLPRETCKPRTAPAGSRADSGKVRSVGTSCLPACRSSDVRAAPEADKEDASRT